MKSAYKRPGLVSGSSAPKAPRCDECGTALSADGVCWNDYCETNKAHQSRVAMADSIAISIRWGCLMLGCAGFLGALYGFYLLVMHVAQ